MEEESPPDYSQAVLEGSREDGHYSYAGVPVALLFVVGAPVLELFFFVISMIVMHIQETGPYLLLPY